jgi:hypothetical protein
MKPKSKSGRSICANGFFIGDGQASRNSFGNLVAFWFGRSSISRTESKGARFTTAGSIDAGTLSAPKASAIMSAWVLETTRNWLRRSRAARGKGETMAKLVFGLNQSLDGYVEHTKFSPSLALFRHFIEHVRGLVGIVYGRRIYEVMRYLGRRSV